VPGYTPGDPESPLQAGEVFDQMKKLSGDPEPEEAVETVVVSGETITGILDAIKKGIWR
jgi:hypothetical protein